MPEENKIWLTIRGRQTDPEGETHEIELMTEGLIRRDGDRATLTYAESEIVGTDGSTMMIELAGDTVKILRTGGYGMNFEFTQGQRCMTLYSTPFGVMEMGALPSLVKYAFAQTDGELELEYELQMQGRSIGNNHLLVSWREDGAALS